MSGRYDYGKGSSRSRDDSRQERRRDRDRSRSPRSRSPRRQRSPEASSNRYSKERAREPDTTYDKDRIPKPDKILKHTEWDESSEDEVPAPPPPPRISKISMGFTKPSAPIKMSLGGKAGAAPKPTIASVFNADDDDEPEEMPAEARMRMRNIGRETPTSAGPNSFGKTKQGFCDAKKLFEKNLKQQLETNEKPALSKFPQTIYKIKPT